jgi:hypothetical protein
MGLLGLAALSFLGSCAPNQDAPSPSAGTIDSRRYVAVGDSYTAGLSDGGLRRMSQEYSFPNLLARQLPGATFTQPLLEESRGTDYLSLLELSATGVPRTQRVLGAGVRTRIPFTNSCGLNDTARLFDRSATASAGLPQNLGVPGLRLTQIETLSYGAEVNATSKSGQFNPYFERLLPAGATTTYRRAVTKVSTGATFFTYFAGLDDYIYFIRGGGECPVLPGTKSGVVSVLTTPLLQNSKKLLDTLSAGGRPGVIALLPDLRYLPLLRQGKGDSLQTVLRQNRRNPKLILWIYDAYFRESRRVADKDFVLPSGLANIGQVQLVAGAQRAYGLDSLNALRNADVITSREFGFLNESLNAYNDQLTALAVKYKLPTVNLADELFNLVDKQMAIGGVVYSSEPVRGNVFSLDGYSFTPRGNGLLANVFLRAINQAYKANLSLIDVNSLPGTVR